SHREDLQSVVGSIGNVHQIVVGDENGVHRSVEALRWWPLKELRACGKREGIIRSSAVSTPVALVGSGFRIEHDHAPVTVTIGDKELVGFAIQKQPGRSPKILDVI